MMKRAVIRDADITLRWEPVENAWFATVTLPFAGRAATGETPELAIGRAVLQQMGLNPEELVKWVSEMPE